ncbi:undecaprenyl-phosphate glucose phosphotransferase [uncultured Tenacibaculum sp.]|uniref:undecaprenyl-phosphate glucose phosphotransferase n=1 Tax=uncultured Tenacibaculum sp. TaxID=174713 RepID=UPI00261B722B|nr:undecaprenyl-phosphate glucose phosphotransferase [uncultured Tenacibaculum sp.]
MKKRYSTYIPIIFLLVDLLIINLSLYLIKDKEYLNSLFLIYINAFWCISSLVTQFYKIYRHYNYFKLLSSLTTHFLVFILGFFTFFTIFREGDVVNNQTKVLVTIISSITIAKLLSFYALKSYRRIGNNYRKVIILGADNSTKKLVEIFTTKKELGYQFLGSFSNREHQQELGYLVGDLKSYENFVLNENIDEIYCSLTELKSKQIKKVKKFANQYNRTVKLIPNSNELYSKSVSTEYYDDGMLILNVKKLPFELLENRIIKRIFDLIFSLVICIFLVSWLYPVLWILIKLESRGPAIFKQEREGFNGKEFVCYKFRSMRINSEANEIHATKNDSRVTKIGAFIRKTSLDEIPQFFNVLLGDMSVVGPRPHMNLHSRKFDKEVSNYMKRKSVKPGITGLAQISGYRGEIKTQSDIVNRVRLDVFYIENWSLGLDIKIIIKTILNIFKGEDKAY